MPVRAAAARRVTDATAWSPPSARAAIRRPALQRLGVRRVAGWCHGLRSCRRPLRPRALPVHRPERAASCRCCRSASGRTSAPTGRRRPTGRSCAGRSTAGSPTSTSPTTTARRTDGRRRTSARYLRDDFAPYRDELIISTKAGWDMWPGPYGQGGGSRKYVLASLDQSLARMGLEYVDIFYSHRFDPETPIEETMMALDHAVRPGKALYAGISSYSAAKTHEAATIARDLGTPLLIHQPSYSHAQPLDRGGPARRARGAGDGLHRVQRRWPRGCSPTATSTGCRRTRAPPAPGRRCRRSRSTSETMARVRGLNEIATGAGPEARPARTAVGAPRPAGDLGGDRRLVGGAARRQPRCAGSSPTLTDDELARIDEHAVEAGINLWAKQTEE